MKKLSIILLALALAVFFAGSAMAFHEGDEGTAEGALGITGTYTLDGEINQDNAGGDSRWFDDDLEVVIRVNMLGVTGVIDLEISDDETFDGNDVEGDSSDSLIDNYWVEWNAMDNLKVKMGEYALTFGKAVFIYADPPAHHIGLIYSGLDNATLSFFLGKVDEGATTNDESSDDDIDSMSLLINVKGVDFFKKLDIIYVSATAADDATATFGDSASYIGLDTAFSAGPVAVAFEYGSVSADAAAADGGNFILAQFGLDELVGFDLNIDYFSSNEDFSDSAWGWGAGDYYPYRIVAWRDAGGPDTLTELTLIGLSGSYKYSDKITFTGQVLVSGEAGPNDDALGTEIDLGLNYKFADNVSARFDYNTLSPDDFYGTADDTVTDMRARFTFKF